MRPEMPTATAFVVTSRPQRYIKQLVTHFGNKVTTEFTDDGGRLKFDFGTCDLRAAATGIEMIGSAADTAQLETLKDVVARHLIRFGSSEELAVSWTPGG
jgi:caffeoyl-CoA O-methyltransferase